MEAAIQKVICLVCQNQVATFRFRKDGYAFFRCAACGALFVSPTPSGLEKIYTKDYFFGAKEGFGYENYDSDKEVMRRTFIRYLKRIEEILPNKGSLFDIGAATGFFVHEASKREWKASGVDASKEAALIAQSNGIDVRDGTFQSLNISKDSFDAVTLLDVVEHVPDPRGLLLEVSRAMKSGGVLVLNTPDAGSLFARLMGRRWHLVVPPEHIVLFNRYNMRLLLEESGFEVVSITCVGKRFTARYILHMLSRSISPMLYPKFFKKHAVTLDAISISLNLRDNMFVLARKRIG